MPTRRFLFSGHANVPGPTISKEIAIGRLGFTQPNGSFDFVRTEHIIDMFRLSSRDDHTPLELVFLNGCESECLGEAVLASGVRTVVCWRTEVNDIAARLFATSFFEAVVHGHGYRRAYRWAVNAVRVRTHPTGWPMYALGEDDTMAGVIWAGLPILLDAAPGEHPDTTPSGFKWYNIGSEEPDDGDELSNEKLVDALQNKTAFTSDEWKEFGIDELKREHFIKSRNVYFRPAVILTPDDCQKVRYFASQ